MTSSDAAIVAEIVSMTTQDCLGHLPLHGGENPQPGYPVELDGKIYTVLERRHRYRYRGGRYQLHRIVLGVNAVENSPTDQTWFEGRRIVGDATCRFNARSPLLRCAIRPEGPCEGCAQREVGG